jgi:hypothetical protein
MITTPTLEQVIDQLAEIKGRLTILENHLRPPGSTAAAEFEAERREAVFTVCREVGLAGREFRTRDLVALARTTPRLFAVLLPIAMSRTVEREIDAQLLSQWLVRQIDQTGARCKLIRDRRDRHRPRWRRLVVS